VPTTQPLSVAAPVASIKLPQQAVGLVGLCVGEDNKASPVAKIPKKRKSHAEMPVASVGVQNAAPPDIEKEASVEIKAKDPMSDNATGATGVISPNPKRQKKRVAVDTVPGLRVGNVGTTSARVEPSAMFMDEDAISKWLHGAEEMSRTMNTAPGGGASGQSDPIFARFMRA